MKGRERQKEEENNRQHWSLEKKRGLVKVGDAGERETGGRKEISGGERGSSSRADKEGSPVVDRCVSDTLLDNHRGNVELGGLYLRLPHILELSERMFAGKMVFASRREVATR